MRRRLVLSGLAIAVILATLLIPAAAQAATCRVIDARSGAHSWGDGSNLERALEAAEAGDHLRISGTCRGNFRMREEIRLTGVATPRFPHATLDAGGHGRVLLVRDGGVIRSLRIRHGRAPSGGGISLFGGRLELRGSTEVSGNRAGAGGGVYSQGDLVLFDASTIRANVSGGSGGGLSLPYGFLTMRDRSSIRGNMAALLGGGVVIDIGGMTMTGFSSVTGNVAGSNGGGIANVDGGVVFRSRARVTGNTAGPRPWSEGDGGQGGGVFFFMASGCIHSRWVRLSPNSPDDTPDWLHWPMRC